MFGCMRCMQQCKGYFEKPNKICVYIGNIFSSSIDINPILQFWPDLKLFIRIASLILVSWWRLLAIAMCNCIFVLFAIGFYLNSLKPNLGCAGNLEKNSSLARICFQVKGSGGQGLEKQKNIHSSQYSQIFNLCSAQYRIQHPGSMFGNLQK